MVGLRSGGRQDGILLVLVWVLTVAALAAGIALVVPLLIFWGVVGLIGAAFLTRIHLRTRNVGNVPAHDEEKAP
jgi:hypothetical protein